MLIQFSVTNYRSILEKQTISMIADNSDDLAASHTLNTGIKGLTRLLPCSVIYGANASGKSNLINAMGVMREIILDSADKGQEGQEISNIEPHALAKNEQKCFKFIFDKILAPRQDTAIESAKKILQSHIDTGTTDKNPSTEMYEFVEYLKNIVPPNN